MIKNILLYIIKSLIQFIEFIEYKNVDKDEDDINRKIINILFTKNIKVETDYGFVPVGEINLTQPFTEYKIELDNGLIWEGADNHMFFDYDHAIKIAKDLTTDDILWTKYGLSKVKSIKKTKHKLSMFDLNVETPEESYYTNGILSHNTISAAIVMLHFVLFENDKSVMIVANKGKTVKEIVKKVKDIYKLVPYFLKKGVMNWNEMSISFDNGSRILSENRTKEPSIGFAIDFLYLDEFAKVPANIIEPYYGAVVPTVSSINNSKIIITSTPDGFNLFHDLLIDAERDEDDPLKNQYNPMRVYWNQVEGRMDVRLLPLAYKLKTHEITMDTILEELKINFNFKISDRMQDNKKYYYIKYDINDDNTKINEVRKIRINNIPLSDLCVITNWKEEETKLIGGEDMFNQEYNLQFVTGDKLLFPSDTLDDMKANSIKFETVLFDKLDKKLSLPYTNLKFIKDKPELFDRNKMKTYHIVAAIDIGEGLGQDYTVLNIFRIVPKPKELIESSYSKFDGIYDYFQLEQIGVFRVNNWSVSEFAELFYLVMFELFDPEKCKVVLEYNTYGATLLSELTQIFDGEHNYSNGIFLRFKHKKEDKDFKIGIKITSGEQEAAKKMMVKDFQNAVNKKNIVLHYDTNINEISTFVKKKTATGFTYKCENGHDDVVMTNVTLSAAFAHVQFKNLIEDIMKVISNDYKSLIEKYAYGKKDKTVSYEQTRKSYKNIYKKPPKIYQKEIWKR
jgi:hypothetical protein